MKINSKEKFIKLFVSTMARMGYLIETFDFEKDLLLAMNNRKYEDLFYFFDDVSDLDFSLILLEMQQNGLISISSGIRSVKISVLDKLFYKVSNEILRNYDESIINLMESLIKEIDLSKSLAEVLPDGVQGIYRLTNPNGIYVMDSTHSIVTDGIVVNASEVKSGSVLVQSANFVIMQSYVENKLKGLELSYKFDDKRFILRIAKEIIDLYRTMMSTGDLEQDNKRLEKLNDINGYRYRKN